MRPRRSDKARRLSSRTAKVALSRPLFSMPLVMVARGIGDRVPEWLIRRLPVAGTFTVQCGEGSFRLRSSMEDAISHDIILRGIESYEADTMPTFLRLAAQAHGAILDIGANIGAYSLAAAAVSSSADIYAFEPVPHTYQRLVVNVGLNPDRRIFPRPFAVTDSSGTGELYVPGDGFPLEASMLKGFRPDATTLSVKTTTVDEFVRGTGIKRVGLLKIDVEGMEHAVVSGALEVLARDRPPIICEILPRRPAAVELPGLLRPLGYSFFHLTAAGPVEFQGDIAGYVASSGSYNFLITR